MMREIAWNLELYCKEELGENNGYSADKIEIDSFYSAMIAIIDKMSLNNKIDPSKAYEFKTQYEPLAGKSFNDFRKNKVYVFDIFDDFKRIIGKEV